MKPPSLTSTQIGAYFALLVMGAFLLFATVWDFGYNSQRAQMPILFGLAGVGVLAVAMIAVTYVVRRRETDPVATYTAPPVALSRVEADPVPQMAAVAPMPNAAPSVAMPTRIAPTTIARNVVKIAIDANAEASLGSQLPEHIPGPVEVPGRRFGDLEDLPYEIGDANFKGEAPESHHGQMPFRVLCGACGAFFTIFTGNARPIQVHCGECNRKLGLAGTVTRKAPHVWTRCGLCGQYQPVLKDSRVHWYLCPTCGQRNGTATLPTGPSIV